MIYLYDNELQKIGVVEEYSSFIWAERFKELGDCELYAPVTDALLTSAVINNFIYDDESEKICIIKKVEIKTNAENGDFITITGTDAKSILYQRINLDYISSTSANDFFTSLIRMNFGAGADANRQIKNHNDEYLFRYVATSTILDDLDFNDVYFFKSVGEIFDTFAESNNLGWKTTFDSTSDRIKVRFFKPESRQNIIFSESLENLVESDYVNDSSEVMNCLVIAGEGQGQSRLKAEMGDSQQGLTRNEVLIENDLSKTTTIGEIKNIFSRTAIGVSGAELFVEASYLKIPVYDSAQRDYILSFGGELVQINGNYYVYFSSYEVANGVYDGSVDDDVEVTMTNLAYYYVLWQSGWEALTNTASEISFGATVLLNDLFVYGQDFYIGDKVQVINGYGVQAELTVSEVLKSADENGYITQLTLTGE